MGFKKNFMKKIFIDYGERINTAILGVIKDILKGS